MHRPARLHAIFAGALVLALTRASLAADAKPHADADAPVEVGMKPGEKAFSGCAKYPADKKFRWGVRGEVGVQELVASIGEISCSTVVLGPQIASRAGKVVLEVPDLLTAGEVWRLFLAALDTLGLTVEESGKTLKIVDAGKGKEVSRPLASGAATPEGDQYVTRLLHVEHARAQELAEVLGKLRGKDGDLSVYAAANAIIVTDRASAVRRIEALARALDVERAASGDRVWVLATHQQSPTELASALEKILGATRRSETAQPAPSGRSTSAPSSSSAGEGPLADGVTAIVPVDGARLVALIGTEPGWRRVLALSTRLDPPAADDTGGQAHVVYLANTNAEELATTLQTLGLSGRTGSAPSGAATGGRAGAQAAPGALPLQGEVRVAPDKVANAIVVFASAADFQMVRDLIVKLDVPRRQVYVEATILDLSVQKARDIGIAFHNGLGPSSDGTTGLISNSGAGGFNTLSLDATSIAGAVAGGGLLAGVIGKSFSIAGTTLPSFGVVLKALEQTKDINVLSHPHLLTMDNVKASLSVGQTFPYAASTLGSAGGATNSVIATYNRQEVALKMDLTPHLNESDSVRLEIEGEISDVPDGASTATAGGPITNKRTIKTAVVVRDGDTIVLGGLQKDSESDEVTKIPFLGDIPVLGRLFQTRSKTRVKQDLLIILTPYIIRGPEDLRRIEQRKENERREFVERFTAFKDESAFDKHVDYARKRGLLVEIDRTAREAEAEAAALRKAEGQLKPRLQEGVVE